MLLKVPHIENETTQLDSLYVHRQSCLATRTFHKCHESVQLTMALLDLLTFDFSFLFGEALHAPPWQCFLTSLWCLTHISTSLVWSEVCFASCSVSWGISKLKSVKCSIPRTQIVVQKSFKARRIPYPSLGPGGWGSQLTGTFNYYTSTVQMSESAIM